MPEFVVLEGAMKGHTFSLFNEAVFKGTAVRTVDVLQL